MSLNSDEPVCYYYYCSFSSSSSFTVTKYVFLKRSQQHFARAQLSRSTAGFVFSWSTRQTNVAHSASHGPFSWPLLIAFSLPSLLAPSHGFSCLIEQEHVLYWGGWLNANDCKIQKVCFLSRFPILSCCFYVAHIFVYKFASV